MSNARRGPRVLFRIWVVRVEPWRPGGWDDLPPRATAVEPAEQGSFSAPDAARFLEGFNGTMLSRSARLWAVAVPVSIRYEGDQCRGQIVSRTSVKLLDCRSGDGG